MAEVFDGRPSDDVLAPLAAKVGRTLPSSLRMRLRATSRTGLGEVRASKDGTLRTRAPAKVNLTLHVLGRRADGYHELESLVVFAGAADDLELRPGGSLSLVVEGPTAPMAGPAEDNLVLRASRALAERYAGLAAGSFHLTKRLPAAAGIGGGSSDAAAALRLLARLNDLPIDHPAVVDAARATGADIPVCLDPRARMMHGAGEEVGPPLRLLPFFAILINPGVAVPTGAVFQRLGLKPGDRAPERAAGWVKHGDGSLMQKIIASIRAGSNDLEPPALEIAPIIGEALGRLRAAEGCRLARMSGSGATVFGLFDDCRTAARAAREIRTAEPGWWVKSTVLR